jgi:glutamate synthase domain-containing protein 1
MSKHNEAQRTYALVPVVEKRGGTGSAGQSGDTQGLPDVAEAGSESVQELVEEGQYFEAEVLLGVETAEDPDIAEVPTRALPDEDLSQKRPGKGLSPQSPSSHRPL